VATGSVATGRPVSYGRGDGRSGSGVCKRKGKDQGKGPLRRNWTNSVTMQYLVGVAEIASALNVSKQRADQLTRTRGFS
jgi:hypothetical protein